MKVHVQNDINDEINSTKMQQYIEYNTMSPSRDSLQNNKHGLRLDSSHDELEKVFNDFRVESKIYFISTIVLAIICCIQIVLLLTILKRFIIFSWGKISIFVFAPIIQIASILSGFTKKTQIYSLLIIGIVLLIVYRCFATIWDASNIDFDSQPTLYIVNFVFLLTASTEDVILIYFVYRKLTYLKNHCVVRNYAGPFF